MRTFSIAFAVALFLSVVLTPVARAVALRIGAVAVPGGRHVHARKIPRLGGIAIALGFTIPLVILLLVGAGGVAWGLRPQQHTAWTAVIGSLGMCLVGAVDDSRGLRASTKLTIQILAALGAYWMGFRIEAIHVPLVGTIGLGPLGLVLTVGWIVGITNAVNLIDGLDGLAAGVSFFVALTNLVVALLNQNLLVALLMSTLMGSLVGFLFFNFNPARIFMGDSGSYFLGYLLAITSAGSAFKTATTVSLLVPMVALGIPIIDTLLAMVRRVIERRPVLSPDRGHIHHRLLDLGLTHRRAVLVIYCGCMVLSVSAVGIALGRDWQTGMALVAVSVVMITMVKLVGGLQRGQLRVRQKCHVRDEQTEALRRMLPALIVQANEAREEDAALGPFRALADSRVVQRVELVDAVSNAVKRTWMSDPQAEPASRREDVTTRFTFHGGSEPTDVRFGWHAENDEVPATVDIQLQILVDAVAAALARVVDNCQPATTGDTDAGV